jgi:hypothetical protein
MGRATNVIACGVALAALGGAIWIAWSDETPSRVSRTTTPVIPAREISAVEGAHPAPIEAFQHAREGDWYAYRVVNAGSFGGFTSTVVAWISAQTDAQVTRSVRGRLENTGEERTGRDEHFPRRGLTVERLTGKDIGEWPIFAVTVADEARAVGGRTFACKKIVFHSKDPMFPNKRTRTELWISPEVPGGGFVAEREVQHMDSMSFEITQELIGFGTASGATWGTRPLP